MIIDTIDEITKNAIHIPFQFFSSSSATSSYKEQKKNRR